MADIRVRRYSPSDSESSAQEEVVQALADALKEIDLARNISVKRALSALDSWSMQSLVGYFNQPIQPPPSNTYGDVVANFPARLSIPRMLHLGNLETHYRQLETETDLEANWKPSLAIASRPSAGQYSAPAGRNSACWHGRSSYCARAVRSTRVLSWVSNARARTRRQAYPNDCA
jgi:hypothetical protein